MVYNKNKSCLFRNWNHRHQPWDSQQTKHQILLLHLPSVCFFFAVIAPFLDTTHRCKGKYVANRNSNSLQTYMLYMVQVKKYQKDKKSYRLTIRSACIPVSCSWPWNVVYWPLHFVGTPHFMIRVYSRMYNYVFMFYTFGGRKTMLKGWGSV